MEQNKYGVHIAHCCYIHGCKYGDKDCPVASGEVAQKYLCYDCNEEYEPYTLKEIEMLRETKSYRPSYKQLKDKITDLEAKLAESEKDRLMWQEMYKSADSLNKSICETDIYPLQEENQQLKDKLEIKMEELHIAYCGIESVKTKNGNLKEEIKELKQQLAEKDKETITFAPTIKNNIELVKKIICLDKDGIDFVEQHNQDKIELLEKVKDKIFAKCFEASGKGVVCRYYNIYHIFDEAIKELEGKKNNE